MEQQAGYITTEEVEEGLDMLGKGYNEPQEIIDESDLRKYRIELPNLYDDSDLDVYEFRLLAHYKRVGRCTESTRTTARKTKMSPAQVSEKRKSIRDKGFIQMQEVPLDDKQFSYIIIVLDKWKENFEKYSTRSLSEHPRTPHEHPVHSVKQRKNNIKKEPIKKVKEAATPQPPEILLFQKVVSHYPKKPQREMVIEAIRNVSSRLGRDATIEDLQPFYTAWCKVSANEWSLVWLLDWAVPGFVSNGKQQTPNVPIGVPVAQSWLAKKEAEAQRVNA
jgi:DNA-binding MarR family transcriptional regulator